MKIQKKLLIIFVSLLFIMFLFQTMSYADVIAPEDPGTRSSIIGLSRAVMRLFVLVTGIIFIVGVIILAKMNSNYQNSQEAFDNKMFAAGTPVGSTKEEINEIKEEKDEENN